MILNKTNLIVFLVGVFLGLCTGFFTAKAIYDQPLEESVTRDTVIVYDTIPHYYPKPVDSAVVRYVTKVLPVVRYDTIFRENSVTDEHIADSSNMMPVVIPITTKHYRAMEYDAWVSGYEPSLDSIKVYKETQYITETITRMKPPNKWELDLIGGLNYNTARQDFTPYAGGEILYKPNRLQVGVRAVVSKTANTGKFEPSVGGVVKIRVF